MLADQFYVPLHRPGSTIVDYVVQATYIQNVEITAAELGIFNKLAENYTMIFDSKKLQILKCKYSAVNKL